MGTRRPRGARLDRLALLAVSLMGGGAAARAAPARTEADTTGDDRDDDARARARTLRALAEGARGGADRGLQLAADEALLRVLAAEGSPVWSQVPREILAHLEELPPIDRTELICRWAIDPDPGLRRAIATAIADHLDVVGARAALDHLVRDPVADVRAAAIAARLGAR
jgi:hypothetical protein